eukprot:m.235193 g.235193  ORF g.235193 m.235193 type:complete len:100 (+) comp19332_c0_seq7:2118-2417(+)
MSLSSMKTASWHVYNGDAETNAQEVDIMFWDIRLAVQLLRQGDGTILDALSSPAVYRIYDRVSNALVTHSSRPAASPFWYVEAALCHYNVVLTDPYSLS